MAVRMIFYLLCVGSVLLTLNCAAIDEAHAIALVLNPDAEKPTAQSQIAESLTLEAVLKVAAQNSPVVQAAMHRWNAATQRRPQDTALPDPKLESTYFIKQHFDQWMIGINQEVPYPGKLILAGKIADKGTQSAYLKYQVAIRNVLADAKEEYFELYYIDRAEVVSAEIEKLYERYSEFGAGGTEIAKPKLPEQFRAESQRAQLGYDIVLLKEMRATEAQRLRGIMGMQENSVIGPVEDVTDPVAFVDDLEKLEEAAKAHNQELAAAGVEVEKAEFQTKQTRRAAIPNLMIGTDFTKDRPDPGKPLHNTVGLTLGITLPIWLGKYRAMNREAREMEAAARADEDAQRLQLRSDLAKAYFNLRNSSRLVSLYRDTLLPQARQARSSAEELYRKGDASLTSLLETTSTIHNFELARLRATADFYQNVSRIERVLGTALILKPAESKSDQKEERKP